MRAKNQKSRRQKRAKAQKSKPAQQPEVETSGVCHFLQTYAAELGKDPETIKKALIRTDYHPVPGQRIPLKVIIGALFDEKYVEEVRAMRLDNEERERKAKERDGVLLEWEATEQFWVRKFVAPMIAALDAAPKDVDRDWVEKVLKPLLRQKLEAPKQEKP